ncbi:MAG: hypothetical protein IPM71_12150 [Bacteroidota bacterium]|nr:MAG: hypothetical protein IPM71_12150 [Bacteroidota bacterium]
MKKHLKTTLLFCLAATLLFSCKQSGKDQSVVETEEQLSQQEVKEGIEEMVFPLPEPMEVYQMLENIGAKYNKTILNPVASIEKYFSSNVKAVNLGVYAADLSYATVFDKKDDIDNYTKVLKILMDDLGIKIDYKTLTSEETRQKAADVDSLVKITTDVFYDTYKFLYAESDPALAVLMANGFYIEGLYVATHISKDTYNNTEMVKIIYNQSKPLEKLIELNGRFSSNQYIQTLQSALIKLKALYDETDGSLTQEQLTALTSNIKTIRTTMVE